MAPLTFDDFEEYGKKHIQELLLQGEKPIIVATFIDYFGDSKIDFCSICGTPVLIRPWLMDAIKQHGLSIRCICCVDQPTLVGQLVMDFAKVEQNQR